MSYDLTTRLRAWSANNWPTMHEAANEIERLRAEVEKWKTTATLWADLPAAVDRLTTRAETAERELTAAREDSKLLDNFDALRQDDVQAHQISEDECEQELLGHFWTTPTVQSTSCREGLRAAIDAAKETNP